ncbi:hypothetical protein [Oricola sp.]|uniref:hypothetical protein n=1 Tax=Oricola sp. TaxID=1979950 RepID=UPI0025FF4A7A|nr:hypothetical protein [Oricola sp.]MCI5074972.1 hypothetical protein [Oricola sp.]
MPGSTLVRLSLAALPALLLMSACTSPRLGFDDLGLYGSDTRAEPTPGILHYADESDDSIIVFSIHGMGKTPACYSETIARMLAGEKGTETPASKTGEDSRQHDIACLASGRTMPVCLNDTVRVDSEGFHDRSSTRPIGKECANGGKAFSLDALVAEKAEAEQPVARSFDRFGTLTYREIETGVVGRSTPLKIRYYAYWWHGDANELQAPFVHHDLSGPYERERAPLNRTIKRVVLNEGLTDAALYAGTFGMIVREGTRNALCLMIRHLNGEVPATAQAAPCRGIQDQIDDAIVGRRIVLLSKSLGSRMLFDALSDDETGEGPLALLAHTPENFAGQIGQCIARTGPLIYMSANQLPLIAIAGLKIDRSGNAGDGPQGFDFLDEITRSPAQTDKAEERLRKTQPRCVTEDRREESRIVAFYDPNDSLGYRAGDHLSKTQKERIFEVTQRYAGTFLGLAALPDQAHDQSFRKANGRRIVMCGAEVVGARGLKAKPECRLGGEILRPTRM